MVNASIKAEMEADAVEMISDFGRQITFQKLRSETTPATWVIQGLVSDPMIATELEIGGTEQRAAFEIRIQSNLSFPAGWIAIHDWAKKGRILTFTTSPTEFEVTAVSKREDSAWIQMKVEAVNPSA